MAVGREGEVLPRTRGGQHAGSPETHTTLSVASTDTTLSEHDLVYRLTEQMKHIQIAFRGPSPHMHRARTSKGDRLVPSPLGVKAQREANHRTT